MKRDIGSGDDSPPKSTGETLVTMTGFESEPRHTVLYDTPFKNPSGFVYSKKNLKDAPIRDFIRCRCASGISTNEDDIYDRFPSRYRRKDCLRILKIFHQNHSRYTKLELVNGLWVLTPIAVQQDGDGK